MGFRVFTEPSAEPVTLAEAKAHLRVTNTDDDAWITAAIVTAREMAEQKTQRTLMATTWLRTLDAFPDAIPLRRPPIQSVTSIKYYDAAGALQTLNNASYKVDSETIPGWVVPAYGYTWPVTLDDINVVQVLYVAGYAAAANVPQGIKNWILLTVGTMYENRESEIALPRGTIQTFPFVEGLLDRHCVVDI